MNYLNFNPLELAAKLIALQNDRVQHLVSRMSKVKTLVHANQLCNQIDNYQRIALFASVTRRNIVFISEFKFRTDRNIDIFEFLIYQIFVKSILCKMFI